MENKFIGSQIEREFLKSFLDKISLFPGEIPSFTQIFHQGSIIAESINRVESEKNSLLHSEILAITETQKAIGSKYLDKCELFTVIEPCLMCAGSIIKARIKKVHYFLSSEKQSGISSISVENIYSQNSFPELTLSKNSEFRNIVKTFFKDKR
ncbi:MAG: nucleoside deaminase [Leptospira sp.]|nr:nucleoside deaminase [Leptospira sp.]